MKIILSAILFSFLWFTTAFGEDENNISKAVDYVGVDATGKTAHMMLVGGFTDPSLKYGLVYMDLASEGGRAAYATVLSAQANGAKVIRLIAAPISSKGDGLSYISLIQTRN